METKKYMLVEFKIGDLLTDIMGATWKLTGYNPYGGHVLESMSSDIKTIECPFSIDYKPFDPNGKP